MNPIRHALAVFALLALSGCGDDDSSGDKPRPNEPDSSTVADSGRPDSGPPPGSGSKLDRPGLERPPTRLPDDLRPPRD